MSNTVINSAAEKLAVALVKATGGIQLVSVTSGRKYDRVSLAGVGQYMVNRATGGIYGCKSPTQVNLRRFYGNIRTVCSWDWSDFPATPIPGTTAAADHASRERAFVATYKKRGRPRKVKITPAVPQP